MVQAVGEFTDFFGRRERDKKVQDRGSARFLEAGPVGGRHVCAIAQEVREDWVFYPEFIFQVPYNG